MKRYTYNELEKAVEKHDGYKGWRQTGSHRCHVVEHEGSRHTIVIPHKRGCPGTGLMRAIIKSLAKIGVIIGILYALCDKPTLHMLLVDLAHFLSQFFPAPL